MKKFFLLCTGLFAAGALLFASQAPQSPPNNATVRGRVVFTGTLQAPLINMASDPGCPPGPQPNNDGDDVIVYAKPRVQTTFPASARTIVLNRVGCRFVPHTITLQVGQSLVIRNSDSIAHNAHGWASINKPFNVSLALAGAETTQSFQQEEVVIPIRDDVHNWELANVGVFAHPYHTVARLNGPYDLVVPAGGYEIVIWHEKLGAQSHSVDVRAGETLTLDMTLN